MDVADPDARAAHVRAAVEYCLRHPEWRLSVQTHKLVGVR
jgi:organic radical activating enzyme